MKNYFRKTVERSTVFAILAVCSGLPGVTLAQQAGAGDALEEVVVTGFKASLQAALDIKKDSIGTVDAIMAEDMADFPDLNLAESLQRIPGVAITRNNGEGRTITVRGLSGLYTLTQVNGMEARAGTGVNNRREFDFNMFASELFSSLVVTKTARADLDEGSLGAIINLNTGRAFNYDEGSTFVVSGSMQNNDLADETSPRMAALYAYNDPNGVWGITGSLAYSDLKTALHSTNTVRWSKSRFRSVEGVNCTANPADAGCVEVADSFHARIPRYMPNTLERERLGVTLGLQFQPADSTLISIDALMAQYDFTNDSKPIEVLFRGNEGGMDVTSYTVGGTAPGVRAGGSNNTLTAMSVDNAWVRAEHYHGEEENEFSQFTLALEHDFTDSVRMSALVGQATSKGHLPVNTTLMFDNRTYNNYSYSFNGVGDTTPSLIYGGLDVANGANFFLTDLRDQVHTSETTNDTLEVNVEWDVSDALQLKGGISSKTFKIDTEQSRRDGTACGLLTGGAGCAPGQYGIPMTQALSELTTWTSSAGAGSTTTWASPNIAAIDAAYGYYDVPLSVDEGRVWDVEEKNTGVYLQVGGELALSDMRFLYNVGVRRVETDQISHGFAQHIWRTYDRPTYSDTLPSLNTALWLNDELVIRFSAADTLARPELNQLAPSASVNSFSDYRVTVQNPNLDPARARNLDLSLEWYFAEDALVSLALFNKDVESFPITETIYDQTWASLGYPNDLIDPTSPVFLNPESVLWDFSQVINGAGATIEGWELGFQAPFSTFGAEGVLGDFGVIANYTYVDSDKEWEFEGVKFRERLTDLSNDQWNLTLYYEGDKFSARASWAYRSQYISSTSASGNGNLFEYRVPNTHIDLSASYDLTDNFALTLEVVNLTDEPDHSELDLDAGRLFSIDYTGRDVLLGARYKF